MALRRPGSGLLLLALLAVGLLASLASAQQVRIPLRRHDLAPGQHPTRSPAALARQLYHAQNHGGHRALNLYVDPSRPVSLRNYFNRMYTGMVSAGTPSKDYQLVFDTGSADMWLFSENASSQKLNYVQYYDERASSTSKVLTTPWSIQYGKGSASGHLVQDDVVLAGLKASQVTFAEATQWSDDFETPQMPLDGLLGLAFSSVSSANADTVVDVLYKQGAIKERVFSFYLTPNGNPDGSAFVLGAPDLNYAAATGGELTYLDLASSQGMWLLSMQGVKLGEETLDFCSTDDCAVLMDTGTSFIGMPTVDFIALAQHFQKVRSDCGLDAGSGLIRCESASLDKLPDISFSLQGHFFTLKASDYYDTSQRVLGFMAIDVGQSGGGGFWILGDTFLKTYYTVFDMDQRRIGIVGAKPGLAWSPPDDDHALRRWGWQLILLIVACAVLLVLILSCLIYSCRSRSSARHVPPLAAGPYVLHNSPPSFASQPHRMQPARAQPLPTAGRQTMPAKQPRSEFARDFYTHV